MRRIALALAAVLVTTVVPVVVPSSATAGPAGSATPAEPYPSVGSGTAVLDHDALLRGFAEPEWYKANIPFLEVPDRSIQDVYYYRWSTYKRHLRYTDQASGYLVTEFHNPPGYSAPLGGIVAAAGHHIAEGRWLRDRRPLDDYLRYWLQGPGAGPKPKEDYLNKDTDDWAHQYSFWAATAAYQRYLVTGDRTFVTALLPDLVRQYDKWGHQFNPRLGLYWSVPVWDAMEFTASSYETDPADPYHGGAGYRPTLNAYQYGDARSIAAIARLAGDSRLAASFDQRASALRDAMYRHLWDPARQFFYHKARADLDPAEGLVSSREEIGFVPWMFDLAEPSTDAAWASLTDPAGFAAPYGPTTVERRSPWFMRDALAGCCRWNGPSWPYSTSQTLTGLANLLNARSPASVSTADYYALLRDYALTQYKGGVPYVAEAHHPDEDRWIYDSRGHSEHYNHSTFTDLVINGLVGLRPSADDRLVVNPLVPPSWDYFALENTPYRGHNVTVLWDRDGSRYHQGAGLQVFVDGRPVARRASLGPVTLRVGTAQVATAAPVDDAANPNGTGYPRPFASYTNAIDSTWDAVDGRIYYDDIPHSRWTNYNSPNASDHLGVDFGVPTPVSDVRMYLYDDGGGVKTPAAYSVQTWDGSTWQPVPEQRRRPEVPAGNALNHITFPAVVTSKIRVVFTNPPGAKVGVTELGAWSFPTGTVSVAPDFTTTYVNDTGRAVTGVRTTLAVPPGWSVRATSPASAHVVRPGGRFGTRWTVTPPPGVRPDRYPVRAFTTFAGGGAASPYASFTVPLDPLAYPSVDLSDSFDTAGSYVPHQPNPGERVPTLTTGDGLLTATSADPFFTVVAGPAPVRSADAFTAVTIGALAGTGAPEDSVFVGWVKDADNYVTAWYNNTRKRSGINVRVNGSFLDTPGDAPLTLAPGDRFALTVAGDTITSYAFTGGAWKPLRTNTIGTVLTGEYRYGFGLRGTSGTISLADVEGRSRQVPPAPPEAKPERLDRSGQPRNR
ncbi:MGH1-like glycoside hydrolase domain-containing protein [Actinophytocola sp.]|uniref:MGH1-like glycoside hydrolase domain-containing protein n=1 Tax=Actinophytocola sp. TaxID=1872138 RepID=UPI002ED909A2